MNKMLNIISYSPIGLLFVGFLAGIFLLPYGFIAKSTPKLTILEPLEHSSLKEKVQEITEHGSTVADTLKNELNEQHQELLADIQKAFGIPEKEWQEMLARLEWLKSQDKLISSSTQVQKSTIPLVNKAQELLTSYSIDLNRITFETINEPKNASDAQAGQCAIENGVAHFLRLNLAHLATETSEVQEAFLRHEIMHLLNYDGLELEAIENLLQERGIEPKTYSTNPAFIALNKFREFRADLLAALHNLTVAQALQEGLKEHMAHYDDAKVSKTHPSCQQRYDKLETLASCLQVEKNMQLV